MLEAQRLLLVEERGTKDAALGEKTGSSHSSAFRQIKLPGFKAMGKQEPTSDVGYQEEKESKKRTRNIYIGESESRI